MKMSQVTIITFSIVLFAAASAIADGKSTGSTLRRDAKEEAAITVDKSRRISLNLPVLTVRKRLSSGKWTGSCSFLPMEILVSGAQMPLRVSISDDTPNGSGATIRNSLWTAALVAALQKESALQGVRISLDFKGGMDGASAGAVMCLGIMTALDGREFPDDFAMTGAILPDGTVGLVGEVPEKLAAAARNSKIKRVAIPAFQRFAKDATGKWVDLFELGRELGLELCPVESIKDAYCFLHREKIFRPVIPTVLSVIRESTAFEAEAAEMFKSRDAALRKRIAGLSSNDYQTISRGFEWKDINPEKAERRFEEGAIFDALNMISRSDACLTASLKSWEFYHDFREEYLNKADEDGRASGKTLRNTRMHEWPIEEQLAFVDDFRKEMSDLCETALGWKDVDNDSTDDGKLEAEDGKVESEEPWFGMVPKAGTSDLEMQLLSLVEAAKAEGHYRYMQKQTFDRAELKNALQDGSRDIYKEIDYDRKKLFFLMSERFRVSSLQGVSIPVMNAGPEIASALELFRKAWVIADDMIEADVDSWANIASRHKDDVRVYLIGTDHLFAVYDAARRWGRLYFSLYDETVNDGGSFGYPSYTDSSLLFVCADLFAEASAQKLKLDNELVNASFAAFVTDRARSSALLGMEACREAGIPCFGAALMFQKAERSRAERSETEAQILADYWKATMSAKALLMAFKNGKGATQGFSGYQLPEDAVAAGKSYEAIIQALLNADFETLIRALPATWVKSASDSAAVVAAETDDETWKALQDVIQQAGRLFISKGKLLAEVMSTTNELTEVDKKIAVDVAANWGERLIGISNAASRETVAKGKLVDVLISPSGRVDGKSAGRNFPMPRMDAQQDSRNTVKVSVSDWSAISPMLSKMIGEEPELFRKMDGTMVLDALIPVFKDCASWKSLVADEMAKLKSEDKAYVLERIRSISKMLKEAMSCTDKDSFGKVLGEMVVLLKIDDSADGGEAVKAKINEKSNVGNVKDDDDDDDNDDLLF